MRIEDDIRAAGGIAKTAWLLRRGWTRRDLADAIDLGGVVRVRKGHYAAADADPLAIAAFRVGGRLAGLSALRSQGVWTPNGPFRLAVSVPRNAPRLRAVHDPSSAFQRGSVELHWDADDCGPAPEPIAAALQRISASVAPEVLFACFESALRERVIGAADAERLRHRFSSRISMVFRSASDRSESGAESLVKFRMLAQGVAFRQQVEIEGVGRVDFVLGERQIVEVDGAGYHSSSAEFERDRRRGVVASTLGFRTLRISAWMVEHEPELVDEALQATLRRGDHLAR